MCLLLRFPYVSVRTMSSPLHLLAKSRRVPLPDVQGNWNRELLPRDNHAPRSCDGGWRLPPPGVRQPAPGVTGLSTSQSKTTRNVSASNGSGLSDLALMSTMMQKLGQLEHKVRSQAVEIQHKDKKISVLEEKLKLLQSPKEEASEPNRVQDLERTCLSLQEQVWEMERFLNDYGMIWVGSRQERELESREEGRGDCQAGPCAASIWRSAGTTVTRNFCVNFDLVLQSIRDLNILAGEGECRVEVTKGGARLTRKAPVPSVPITLYKNGILVFEGPFRAFQEPSTQIVMDLMDGYFPSEMQERFPDGVTFQVTDRREEVFKGKPRQTGFPGTGYSVGGATAATGDGTGQDPERAELHTACHMTGGTAADGSGHTERFLRRLPRKVVKAGKVIDVRDTVRSGLQASSVHPEVTVIDTPTLQDLKTRSVAPGDVTSLRVRSEDGDHTFLLKMLCSDTIGQLRCYLDMHRGLRCTSYDVISAFPLRRHDDNDQTLLSCGLTPNAVLLLRIQPQPVMPRPSAIKESHGKFRVNGDVAL
ncbi:UBX domain-containing protein 11-like isoform X3 [Brienomyrus brachyistius]|uniref:UBX domain-containing protein 11-like isoform X3 n=1 Tax=Brienomyrus brachyistius TaxID=42636 RepID=UPI0020B2FDF8|nr:UBX domain-containing protein 11-like isoform X3 [Brienomyrus brachyistius]